MEEERRLEEERLAEQRRLEEERLEQQRLEQQRQAELAEQRRQQEAAAAAAAKERQATLARRQRIKGELEQKYKQSIRKAVSRKFRPPAGLRPGASCTVRAQLVFPNEVVDVQVERCSGGGAAMARAVEKAVLAAQPFPVPPHKAVFQRVLIFEFNPQ